MKVIDARGLSCPEPVVLLRAAMQSGEAAYQILVDNHASRENTTRYAQHQGYQVQVQENGQEFASIGVWRAFSQGLACNLLNPKATLFFFSVFTQLIDPASSLSQKALIGGIIFIQGVLYWPLVVLALQHPRVIRAIRRVQRSVDRLLGGLLLALGIKVALS